MMSGHPYIKRFKIIPNFKGTGATATRKNDIGRVYAPKESKPFYKYDIIKGKGKFL